jgi:hypothetical protein
LTENRPEERIATSKKGERVMFVGLQQLIINRTLRLVALGGEMMIQGEQQLFVDAKQIAKEMATWLNMPEALEEWPCAEALTEEQVRIFCIATGVLAKACEALDHLEDYPSRKKIEESLRSIFSL